MRVCGDIPAATDIDTNECRASCKLIVTEQDKFEADEVLSVVRRNLEGALGRSDGRGQVVVWPADSAQIRDGIQAFLVAYLSPDWDERNDPLERLAGRCGDAPRKFKNA